MVQITDNIGKIRATSLPSERGYQGHAFPAATNKHPQEENFSMMNGIREGESVDNES